MMSRDLVRFRMRDDAPNHMACARAAMKAFSLTMSQVYCAIREEQVIVCRPSQFARFLIYRSKEVSCNTFRQFQAELIPAQNQDPILDVTRNPS